MIFDDGSVEVETADGVKRFDTVAELMEAAQRNQNGDGRPLPEPPREPPADLPV